MGLFLQIYENIVQSKLDYLPLARNIYYLNTKLHALKEINLHNYKNLFNGLHSGLKSILNNLHLWRNPQDLAQKMMETHMDELKGKFSQGDIILYSQLQHEVPKTLEAVNKELDQLRKMQTGL